MLDTNVLIFAHGPATGRVEEGPSRELWAALIAHKRDILIAAPTLAETLRGGTKVQMVRGVEVISFDRRAGELLGLGLPFPAIKQVQVTAGLPLTHLKFDSLIMACAVRGQADVLVTYDRGIAKLQASADPAVFGKLRIVTPDHFQVATAAAAPPPAGPAPSVQPPKAP
jgi:predicted nucleic acid-binding protein